MHIWGVGAGGPSFVFLLVFGGFWLVFGLLGCLGCCFCWVLLAFGFASLLPGFVAVLHAVRTERISEDIKEIYPRSHVYDQEPGIYPE